MTGDKTSRTELPASYQGPGIRLALSRLSINIGRITECMAHFAEFFPTFMPVLSGKMENRVKYWPGGHNRAGNNEGGVSKQTLLFMKPHIDHFPLIMSNAHIMWCYKC